MLLVSYKSVQADHLESGDYIAVYHNYSIDKKYNVCWSFDAENYNGTTSSVYIEVWVMTLDSYETWDKSNMSNIPGQLLSSGVNGNGKFRVPSENIWFVLFYNKPSSLDVRITYNMEYRFEPIFSTSRKILLCTLSSTIILSGIAIPVSIRWWKKSKPRRILRKSNKEALIQESIKETLEQIGSTTPVSLDRIIDYTRKILKDKVKNDSTNKLVPSRELTKSVCENNITLILAQNVDLGEYYKVEQVFVKTHTEGMASLDPTKKTFDCHFCGAPLEEKEVTCSTCKKEVITCSVCKLPITFGETIGKCSLCEKAAHLTHIQEWVKAKGKCPSCLQEIPQEGILIEDSSNEKQIKK